VQLFNGAYAQIQGEHASEDFRRLYGIQYPRYQWFWAGNQQETEILTPDLKHTVKRHIVVKRVIYIKDFPQARFKRVQKPLEVAELEKAIRLRSNEFAEKVQNPKYRRPTDAVQLERQNHEKALAEAEQALESLKKEEEATEAEVEAETRIDPTLLDRLFNFSFFIEARYDFLPELSWLVDPTYVL
jgi:hypothetical protein